MPDFTDPAVPRAFATDSACAISVVVMGVAGCGKSTVGELIARELALPLVEGDDFHPAANVQKMQQGIALTDEDRAQWLQLLGAQLALHAGGMVLTCSALKRGYRQALRQASAAAGVPLFFVYLAIDEAESLRRVGTRAGHYYPASLVASQFEALEDPSTEPGVFSVRGAQPVDQLVQQAVAWLLVQSAAAQALPFSDSSDRVDDEVSSVKVELRNQRDQ
jgi:gluconokinase